jgi:putative superfamily III holin-X
MSDRSIGELLSELARDTTTLVRQEILLAKIELGEKASLASRQIALIAAGGAVLYAGLLALIGALILLLADHMPPWLAAMLVGAAVAAIGYWLVRQQLDALKRLDPKPRATVETLRQDKEWVKEQLQ